MIQNYTYITNFEKSREMRMGASDVPALIPNPEKPTESLAGYDNTAVTKYYEKIDGKEWTYSLPAEMGHFLENKSLELFIRTFFDSEIAKEFIKQKMLYEMSDRTDPEKHQVGLFRHNVEYIVDGMVVHPDMIYLGEEGAGKVTVNGITVDKSKPFYVEAKSARQESVKRGDSLVKGYDFDLTDWKGIPLKHYVQMQYGMGLFEVETGYLPLLYNTSEFQVWKIDEDKKWQQRIFNVVGKMLEYLRLRKPPKELSICQADIVQMYPDIKKDFLTVSGDLADKLLEIKEEYKKAVQQKKNWESVEKDCLDAMSVYLKDYDSLMIGSDTIAKWRINSARESIGLDKEVTGKLSFIKWLELNDKQTFSYLKRKGYLKIGQESRTVKIK